MDPVEGDRLGRLVDLGQDSIGIVALESGLRVDERLLRGRLAGALLQQRLMDQVLVEVRTSK